MKAILELEQMGFTFTLDGDDVVDYAHHGERPDPELVRPLLEDLKRHRDEAVHFLRRQVSQEPRSLTDFEAEAEAEALLLRCDGSAEWAREWAELHDRWEIPCHGFDSWMEWAESVPRESDGRRAKSMKQWFSDPPPMKPCRPFGTGEHRRFWRRLDKWASGWTCVTCHPPPPDVAVETWEIPL